MGLLSKAKKLEYLYFEGKNANDMVETKRNANKMMTACLTNLEKLRGRGELVRGWKAGRTSAWEGWLLMGSPTPRPDAR